jgi:predicted transcriptional regulator
MIDGFKRRFCTQRSGSRVRTITLAEEDASTKVDLNQVSAIVSSYVRHHQIVADQLAALIVEVHRALANLGRGTPPAQPPEPAVPIRRSVQPDHVVCLECGYHAQVLRRHLRVAHGLEVADYRARWKLPADHPITAPSYSARRSTMAKEIGLGRRAAAEPSPSATERPETARRGRRPRRTPPRNNA